jgi:hypothetical protein
MWTMYRDKKCSDASNLVRTAQSKQNINRLYWMEEKKSSLYMLPNEEFSTAHYPDDAVN